MVFHLLWPFILYNIFLGPWIPSWWSWSAPCHHWLRPRVKCSIPNHQPFSSLPWISSPAVWQCRDNLLELFNQRQLLRSEKPPLHTWYSVNVIYEVWLQRRFLSLFMCFFSISPIPPPETAMCRAVFWGGPVRALREAPLFKSMVTMWVKPLKWTLGNKKASDS